MTVEELQAAFLAKLQSEGMAPHNPDFLPRVRFGGDPSRKIDRYRLHDDDSGDKDGAYVLYEHGVGLYQDWGKSQTGMTRWSANGQTPQLTDEQKEQIRLDAEHARKAEELARNVAVSSLRDKVKHAPPCPDDHPYLAAKNVGAHGLLYPLNPLTRQPELLVPLRAVDGTVQGGQWIYREGKKRNVTNTRVEGFFHQIGPDPISKLYPALFVAEGYATAATVHELTGVTTLCVTCCANIVPVAKSIRSAYPFAQIFFAADDDWQNPEKPGETKAREAARIVDGTVVLPDFLSLDRQKRDADFNDLARLEGHDTAKGQLVQVLPVARSLVRAASQGTELNDIVMPPAVPLVGSWCYLGDFGFVYATRGEGKSLLSLWLIKRIIEGTPEDTQWWNCPGNMKVGLVDGEMPWHEALKRVNERGLAHSPNFFLLHHERVFQETGRVINLFLKEWRDEVTRWALAANLNALVLDNVSTLIQVDNERVSESWTDINNWLLSLRRQHISVFLLHHAGVSGRMRGTTSREDTVAFVIKLEKQGGADDNSQNFTEIRLVFEKARYFGAVDANPMLFRFQDGNVSIRPYASQDKIVDLLSSPELGLNTASALAKELGVSAARISQMIAPLKKAGRVYVEGRKYLLAPEGISSATPL